MRARALILSLLAAALLPASGLANPQTGPWVDAGTGAPADVVNYDQTIQFSITSATDSATFSVATPYADLCFDPDTLGSAGSARISVYRVILLDQPTIDGSILLPTVPVDNSDCLQLVRAVYWVEVTTGPTGGETPVVTVSGRSS